MLAHECCENMIDNHTGPVCLHSDFYGRLPDVTGRVPSFVVGANIQPKNITYSSRDTWSYYYSVSAGCLVLLTIENPRGIGIPASIGLRGKYAGGKNQVNLCVREDNICQQLLREQEVSMTEQTIIDKLIGE